MNGEKGIQPAIKSKEHFAQCLTDKERYFTSDKNSEIKVYLEFYSIDNIPYNLFMFCFQLMEKNMKDMYLKSNDGWNRKFKLKEMKERKTRFMVARLIANDVPVAFSSFQFDYEFEKEQEFNSSEDSYLDQDDTSFISEDLEDYREVLYCYELQVDPNYRAQGIGEFMVNNLNRIAQHWEIPYILLTVFLNNHKALSFYKKLGFKIDKSSPSRNQSKFQLRKYDYEILFKSIDTTNIPISLPTITKKQHTRSRSSISFKSLTW